MKIEISKKLVLVNSASNVVSRLLQASVLIWLQQYLLRRIPADEYSLLPVLGAVMVFTPILTTVLTAGISRYIVEAYARRDRQRLVQITSTMLPILVVTGAVVLVAGLVFARYVDHVLTIAPERVSEARIMMAILMVAFSVRLPLIFFGSGFHVRQRFVFRNLIDVGTQLLGLSVLFALLMSLGPRVMWVVIGSAVGSVSDVVLVVVFSRRLVPELRLKLSEFRWSVARQLTSFGAWSLISQIGTMIQHAANPIILNKLSTPVEVASFHVGSMADRQICPLVKEATWPLQPVLTAKHVEGDTIWMAGTFMRGGRIAGLTQTRVYHSFVLVQFALVSALMLVADRQRSDSPEPADKARSREFLDTGLWQRSLGMGLAAPRLIIWRDLLRILILTCGCWLVHKLFIMKS